MLQTPLQIISLTSLHSKSSSLNIAGYGMVFLRHEVIIKGKKHSVMSKISPVYYAPGMAYQLFSVGSLLQK